MRLIDADELKTAFPAGESVRTECVRATIDNMATIIPSEQKRPEGIWHNFSIELPGGSIKSVNVCNNCWNGHLEEVEGEESWKYCPNCGAYMLDPLTGRMNQPEE